MLVTIAHSHMQLNWLPGVDQQSNKPLHTEPWHAPANAHFAIAGLVLLDNHAQELAQFRRCLQLQCVVRAASKACLVV